jgi:hypothetical protein
LEEMEVGKEVAEHSQGHLGRLTTVVFAEGEAVELLSWWMLLKVVREEGGAWSGMFRGKNCL